MPAAHPDSSLVAALMEALATELPDVSSDRLRQAAERAAGVVPEVDDDAEVDSYLARVDAETEPGERARLLRELATILERCGDVERALSACIGALTEDPDGASGERLMRLARASQRTDELVTALDAVLAGEVDGAAAAGLWLALSSLHRDAGRDDDRLAALEAAARNAPHRADVLRALSDAYAGAGRLRASLDVLARLVDTTSSGPELANLYREMAAGWQRLDRFDRAAECWEWVLSLAPEDDDAYAVLEPLYRESRNLPALVHLMCRRAERCAPAERADVFVAVAEIYRRELGDTGRAVDFYRAAADNAPDRLDILSTLAALCQEREAHDDAIVALERIARATPDRQASARVLRQAGAIAWRALSSADTARDLISRSLDADPDCVASIEALAALHRERGELPAAIEVLSGAARRPALAAHAVRLLCDAASLSIAIGDHDGAVELARAARFADMNDQRAGELLADLLWEERSLDELVPLLELLCHRTTDSQALRQRLSQLGTAAAETGRYDLAREALARAVELDPEELAACRALGDLLFDQEEWSEAAAVVESVLHRYEDQLPTADCVELHYRAGRSARELGQIERARIHVETALALAPAHRPSLLLHARLDDGDSTALVADQLALAASAPPDQQAAILAGIGDLYAERGDRASARQMYREALAHRPTDHLLLSKCLSMVAEQGDWSESLDLLERLIETEQAGPVRAKYCHVAAMICRDELERHDDAVDLLHRAIEADPAMQEAADAIGASLDGRDEELARFYYQRLDQLRARPDQADERLRLWDRLSATCDRLGLADDALCAHEVAVELDPTDAGRRQKLADRYLALGDDGRDKAIGQHQSILRHARRRVASYEALRGLYWATSQLDKARACDAALDVIGMRPVAARSRVPTARPMALEADGPVLTAKDYHDLALGGVDRLLSVLFARVAPVLARHRAHPTARGRVVRASDPRPFARAFRHVASVMGVDRPVATVDTHQAAACVIQLRETDGVIAPVVTFGRAALDGGGDDRALVFSITQRLVDLRGDRFARLLCPRADELAAIVELALAMGSGGPEAVAGTSNTARWLAETLRPIEIDQLTTIGARLAERGVDPARAAADWLDATDRVADRTAYLMCGDLATCVRAIEREPAARVTARDRILDLVWASVTEQMFAVLTRLERGAAEASAETDVA